MQDPARSQITRLQALCSHPVLAKRLQRARPNVAEKKPQICPEYSGKFQVQEMGNKGEPMKVHFFCLKSETPGRSKRAVRLSTYTSLKCSIREKELLEQTPVESTLDEALYTGEKKVHSESLNIGILSSVETISLIPHFAAKSARKTKVAKT